MSKVFVIGGGAAGMMAAIAAAKNGHSVEVFEKNDKLGKKLFITGKGRCNITNSSDKDVFFENIISNKKFLYSSYNNFNNEDTIKFFNSIGLATKVERGNRVFPVSDKSSDVINALKKHMEALNITINYKSLVDKIIVFNNKINGIEINKKRLLADNIIVATGGLSYPLTGSTGDGYRFAKENGHEVTKLSPSLVPLYVKESNIKELMGLSLKNIGIKVYSDNKQIYEDFGELLFTHFGLSGPLILSASSYINSDIDKSFIKINIDLKPALTHKQLDGRILKDFNLNINKDFKNSLDKLFPSKLINTIINRSNINPEKKVNEITKAERLHLVDLIKKLEFNVLKLADYNQAVITKGGINIKEINPSTMESKKISNLYFVGEVLDIDALTGGYNLQIAWTTGFVAGNSIKDKKE